MKFFLLLLLGFATLTSSSVTFYFGIVSSHDRAVLWYYCSLPSSCSFLFVLVYPVFFLFFFLSFVCVFVFHGSLFSNPLYIYLLERKRARCPVMYIKDRHIMAVFFWPPLLTQKEITFFLLLLLFDQSREKLNLWPTSKDFFSKNKNSKKKQNTVYIRKLKRRIGESRKEIRD